SPNDPGGTHGGGHGSSQDCGHDAEHGHGRGAGHGGDHGAGPGHGHGGSGGGHGHAHGHSHSHGPAAPVSRHLRKVIAAILIPFGAAVLVGLVVLWPGGAPAHERTGVGFDRQTQQATVTKVESVSCASVNASGGTPTG
ncbi:YibE/F family protein, partial [Streptomyces sp. NPDC059618]